jgi:hypothetical protein
MHVPRPLAATALIAVLLGFAFQLAAQVPSLEPNTPENKPAPTVSFEFVLSGASPAHYALAVESSGRAAYQSNDVGLATANDSTQGTPYMRRFVVSNATSTRIFALARQANYFKGNFEYSKGRVADTGTKTLSYGQGSLNTFGTTTTPGAPTVGVRSSTTYNYSDNAAIQQLTTIFEGISNTLELGTRLDYLHRFDRLGLDAELKQAEEKAKNGQLLELQVIEPNLRAVADDTSVLNVARERAQHLLKLAQASGTR